MVGQQESIPVPDPIKDWHFTFGHGQPHFPGYVVIRGSFRTAREEMIRRYGTRWSMMYESAEAAQVVRWNLREVK